MPSSPSIAPCIAALLLFPLLVPARPLALTPDTGCSLQERIYTCNWVQFKTALDSAKTIGIETQHIDRQADAQLHHLITDLGKVAATSDAAGDLTMLLIPIESGGVDLGPADHDVATLRIYARNGSNPRGTLLWAETYRGQGDRPWPSIVHALISQFKDRLPKR